MLRSFKSKALAALWQNDDASHLDARMVAKIKTRLSRLDAAEVPAEMNVPGYHFHALRGDLQGMFSVRVTANWRLTFGWQDNDAIGVDLVDYH